MTVMEGPERKLPRCSISTACTSRSTAFTPINNLSLTLEPGEMRAIIGTNGAGKTTMMDIITGKTKPDRGHRCVRRLTDLTRLDETRIAELGIGRKFRSRRCSRARPSRTICCWPQCRSQRQGHAVLARSPDEVRAIDRVLETIRLTDARNRLAGSLSHGQKQWLEIGMLLAQDPKAAAGRRARRRNDRRRDASDRGAAQGNQQGKDGHGRRARHDLRARTRRQGDLPA
jgi:ABC-type uncharacterized transport system ATPase subunit